MCPVTAVDSVCAPAGDYNVLCPTKMLLEYANNHGAKVSIYLSICTLLSGSPTRSVTRSQVWRIYTQGVSGGAVLVLVRDLQSGTKSIVSQ